MTSGLVDLVDFVEALDEAELGDDGIEVVGELGVETEEDDAVLGVSLQTQLEDALVVGGGLVEQDQPHFEGHSHGALGVILEFLPRIESKSE